jgi:hypothetical protein
LEEVTMPAAPPSLDRRIADCLGAKEHEIEDLQALIKEATDTLGSIEAEQVFASRQALDPSVADYATQKQRADTAALMAMRLKNALPRLQTLLSTATERERLKKWNVDMDRAEAVRDQLAKRFRDLYPKMVTELVTLFDEIKGCDETIGNLHLTSGCGVMRRLDGVECTARGIAGGFNAVTKSIVTEIKLPGFALGSGAIPMAWPRPVQPMSLSLMMPSAPPLDPQLLAEVEAAGGFENGGYRKVMERRRQQEAERWAEQGAARERERERLNAEEARRQHEAAQARRRQGM